MDRLKALAANAKVAPWMALALGLVSALGFKPLGIWPLTLLAFTGLLFLIQSARTWRLATFNGWMFGVGQFVLGLNWIATAFTYQAKMPAWLGWVAVVLLSLYLAVYPAIAALVAKLLARRAAVALPLGLAAGWILGEWLRSFVFTGFAWNPVGVVLVDTPLRHLTVWVGTYALSGIAALLGGTVFWLAHLRWRPAFLTAAAIILALLVPRPQVIFNDGLTTFDVQAAGPPPANGPVDGDGNPIPTPPTLPPTEPETAPAPYPPPPPPAASPAQSRSVSLPAIIRIVQPNIDQSDKWRPGFDRIAADRLTALGFGLEESDIPATIVFWPEAAVTKPLYDERAQYGGNTAVERVRAARGMADFQTLVTGGVGIKSTDGRTIDTAINSVFVLTPEASLAARYDKAHLVPYGEYLPMRWLLEPLGLSRLAPGNLDFDPGPGPDTIPLRRTAKRMGVQICYEIIFSGRVVDADDRPDFIFNPSNDAWFGAWGPPQHLAQARLRATEEGLPVIRSTPTGISAQIAADGSVTARIGMGEAGIIDQPLQSPVDGGTLFSRFGNVLALAIALILAALSVALSRRER
ncbi:apolipoprotein N-acyltransferase [Sphingomicrobium sp. XHP0235]|uniref:apolipoprotein N-acyltransferase n=1 Tax=Sphingomicrobium aquimarinum TaxID=3133971 RepID=UPI0031FEA767